MNTKELYIQPQAETIEMEIEAPLMAGSNVNVSEEEITSSDSPLRSRKNFWSNNE